MMKSFMCIGCSVLLIPFGAEAQDPQSGFSKFVPAAYKITGKIYGDLNKDGLEDCVLLVKGTEKGLLVKNEYQEELDHNRRGIIVLFKKEKGYNLVFKNYDCFSSENEDGGIYFAPELSLEVKNQNLYIHYAHGRYGYWRYTLRYRNADFELIGYDDSDNQGPVVNSEMSVNFLTGKKKVRTNVNREAEAGEEIFEEEWTHIKTRTLKKLSEIDNFDDPYELIYKRL